MPLPRLRPSEPAIPHPRPVVRDGLALEDLHVVDGARDVARDAIRVDPRVVVRHGAPVERQGRAQRPAQLPELSILCARNSFGGAVTVTRVPRRKQ